MSGFEREFSYTTYHHHYHYFSQTTGFVSSVFFRSFITRSCVFCDECVINLKIYRMNEVKCGRWN